MTGVSVAAIAVYFFVDPLLESFWLNVINLIMYGSSCTIAICLVDALTYEVIGPEHFGSAIGWIAMKGGILRLFLLYTPGTLWGTLGERGAWLCKSAESI